MEELKIRPIEDGTVIDHIPRGQALNVLRVLGVDSSTREVVSVAMNVPSDAMGRKDIVKVEDREIGSKEADIIALIAPDATVNVIRDFEVREKYEVSMPDEIRGVLSCSNPNCVTNTREPVETVFDVRDGGIRCEYCGTVLSDEIADYLA
ncbi:MAG: aspartate carbamoyltransferase regulatory subunit [Halobacteriales archaeon]|nr:aspartate carbamoyltransferase regulatory subunit [Halobacteriales archaeon]